MFRLNLFALLAAHALGGTASPLQSSTKSINPGGPIQPCTTTLFKQPSIAQTCTAHAGTVTSTASVECGGCVLKTEYLGHGLQCQHFVTFADIWTTTVTSCAETAKATA
ncbi:hypothetical protein LTR97_009689 [Elasticomyces elasticus]|uniref:Uncharacterized protein n=1 Tax=Elasticomyces elasticus TaxID=574655 RepID=A0AAN7VZH4_9PEZI|nr:hypothetical protein LTR97_009689 [Elasticomyces elasticus]